MTLHFWQICIYITIVPLSVNTVCQYRGLSYDAVIRVSSCIFTPRHIDFLLAKISSEFVLYVCSIHINKVNWMKRSQNYTKQIFYRAPLNARNARIHISTTVLVFDGQDCVKSILSLKLSIKEVGWLHHSCKRSNVLNFWFSANVQATHLQHSLPV